MKNLTILLTVALLFTFTPLTWSEHEEWSQILKTYVQDGRVQYKKLHETWKNENHILKIYLKKLDSYSKKEVEAWNKNDQMAFYINAYNAYTIALILDHYPVKSIKDIGTVLKSPWDLDIVHLFKENHTLNWIEHEVLRPVFKDPRVHAAVNCASKSCPKLQSQAFMGDTLSNQLDSALKEFIADTSKNQFDTQNNFAKFSKIFKWYGDDFSPSVPQFLVSFAPTDGVKKLLKDKDLKIDYLDYDWSLNGE
ncbi:MAG: DUF547 domain-containing protein [Deltaproteobacteria bacterium]|nr:DUF547 domain-containing protein [Deltaproteobacteria bacterium]